MKQEAKTKVPELSELQAQTEDQEMVEETPY
jgi:hypothetical protein